MDESGAVMWGDGRLNPANAACRHRFAAGLGAENAGFRCGVTGTSVRRIVRDLSIRRKRRERRPGPARTLRCNEVSLKNAGSNRARGVGARRGRSLDKLPWFAVN